MHIQIQSLIDQQNEIKERAKALFESERPKLERTVVPAGVNGANCDAIALIDSAIVSMISALDFLRKAIDRSPEETETINSST